MIGAKTPGSVHSSNFYAYSSTQSGTTVHPANSLVSGIVVRAIQWGVGLAALIKLWRPESSQFFAAARQAKFATAFSPSYPGAPNPGAQAPGYPPTQQYGQPPHTVSPRMRSPNRKAG